MNATTHDVQATPTSVDTLRARLDGDFVTPEDSTWDEARLAWNLAVDQRPAAVAIPTSADDGAEVVRYARANGLRVSGQGTGHNAHPLAADLEDTILVKTHRMRRVEIDPGAQIARAEAGAVWADVTYRAAEHGLAPLA